jgi:hypothetical protein
MPAFVRGVAYSVRHRLRDVLPILAVTLNIAYALMQGNVGTAYRQRTQVTMSTSSSWGWGSHRAARDPLSNRLFGCSAPLLLREMLDGQRWSTPTSMPGAARSSITISSSTDPGVDPAPVTGKDVEPSVMALSVNRHEKNAKLPRGGRPS